MEWDNSLIQVVIALDFGTSRSGYAYSFTDDPETVSWNMNWGQYAPPYAKTRTCLLYSPDDKPIDWGFSAQEKLIKLQQEKKANGYYLIGNFKMQIPNKDGIYRDINEEKEVIYKTPVSKKEVKVFDLVVDYLRFLTQAALSEVRSSTVLEVPDKNIQWVLTVPAIWRDEDKQFMREAAQKVGIINSSEEDRDRLLFALEPEAAAFYCHKKGQLSFDFGTFMVVDSGGGTVDIVTYRISEDGIEGIQGVPPSGGPYGSTYVDKEFLTLLSKKLSTKTIELFQDEHPIDCMRMMQFDWESSKCGIKLEDLSQEVTLYIPFNRRLELLVERHEPDTLKRFLSSQNDNFLENIKLTPEEVNSLFKPTLIGIISKIEEQFSFLENSSNDFQESQQIISRLLNMFLYKENFLENFYVENKCDAIILVGGYSRSKLLQQYVKDEFSSRLESQDRIITPSDPEVAVLAGAVYFGMNPERWIKRVAKRTYGCDVMRDFIEGTDPPSKKIWFNKLQKNVCVDSFDIYVSAGDLVGYNYKIVKHYTPVAKDQTRMEFKFYSTDDPKPRFIDDPGVVEHKQLIFERDDKISEDDWVVETTMYFGRTEIKVEIKDLKSGNVKGIELDFRSHFT